MNPSFVLDASLTMAWCFKDASTSGTDAVLDRLREESAAVPGLWFLEVANVLVIAERAGRIEPEESSGFIRLLDTLQIVARDGSSKRAFDHLIPLCRTHGLTAYDAAYLDLAMGLEVPLATLDRRLAKAAREADLVVLGR